MAQKLIATNGDNTKSINPWDVDSYPEAWTWLSGQPQSQQDNFYATVSAAFRAFNLKANTISAVPFILYDIRTGEEVDDSNNWQNVCKILPNPSELLRLDVLSYMSTNAIYNIKTTDALGYKTKGIYNAVPYAFSPVVNQQTKQLEYVSRQVGMTTEIYKPDDPRLIRMWRLDHTTEVLPSENTEAKAIMSSAGIIMYQDAWVQHFYRRGGIKPTLIAMKGLISTDDADRKERDWTAFLRGLGKFTNRIARIFNAESMTIQPFGSGVDDMKDNNIYQQAIANIAMGTGMPLSLLLANSSNYATAQEEKATWYESDIIPFCRWLQYEYNRQLWEGMGYYMQFQPQTLDPNQQDETEKASAIGTYMDIIAKCPTYDLFIGMADTIGIEVSESLDEALKKYYAEKAKAAEVMVEQMKPKDEPAEAEDTAEDDTEDTTEEDTAEMKWIPTMAEFDELRVWREVAVRRYKRGEGVVFEYQPHYGGLPDSITKTITARLAEPREWTEEAIKAAFDFATIAQPEVKAAPVMPAPSAELLILAQAMNRLADTQATKSTPMQPMNITLNAQMPAQGEPSVTFAPVIQPSEVQVQNNTPVTVTNQVKPTDVKITNEVTVQPADVTLPPMPKEATITMDSKGNKTLKVK